MTDKEFQKKLIDSLSNAMPEIRFSKGQQFRSTYYSILLFAAIVALFQIKTVIPYPWHHRLKCIACVLIIGIAIMSSWFQWRFHKSMNEYRKELPKELSVGMQFLPTYNFYSVKIDKDERKTKRIAIFFTFGLFFVILCAAAATFIVVALDH